MIGTEYKEDKSSTVKKDIVFLPEDGFNNNTTQSQVASRNSVNTMGVEDVGGSITPTGVIQIEINDVNYLIEVERI